MDPHCALLSNEQSFARNRKSRKTMAECLLHDTLIALIIHGASGLFLREKFVRDGFVQFFTLRPLLNNNFRIVSPAIKTASIARYSHFALT